MSESLVASRNHHRSSLRETAYDYIRRRIADGEYPLGARISEQTIAEEMGISRTPVRTAFHQLESEGILEQIPRYGTIVRNIARHDLSEMFDYRLALEGYACELAAARITAGDLGELHALCEEMAALIAPKVAAREIVDPETSSVAVEADKQFHLLILRATGNRRLMRSAMDSRLLAVWTRCSRSQTDILATEKTWRQHAAVYRALAKHDRDEARGAMIEHLTYAKENALILFDRAQAERHASEIMKRIAADGEVQ